MIDYGLKDRVALITGANNPWGIGATTALAFAREGAKIVLVYKRVDRPFDATKTDKNGVDRYYCLVMSEEYIKNHFADIKAYANVIEARINDDCIMASVLADNAQFLTLAQKHNVNYILIEDKYEIDIR